MTETLKEFIPLSISENANFKIMSVDEMQNEQASTKEEYLRNVIHTKNLSDLDFAPLLKEYALNGLEVKGSSSLLY